jgi:hypothetical protein
MNPPSCIQRFEINNIKIQVMIPGPASLWRQRKNWSFKRQKYKYITKEIYSIITDSGKDRHYRLLHIIKDCSNPKCHTHAKDKNAYW